ncbi:MAG: hypothetical protein QXU87_08320 [Candidatus Caldarchaeum sp.]
MNTKKISPAQLAAAMGFSWPLAKSSHEHGFFMMKTLWKRRRLEGC